MDEKLVDFLTWSPLAAKIRLLAAAVVVRTEMSPLDVMSMRKAGGYGPVPAREEICELHVGGQRVALGKIVKRKGEYYFKTIRIAGGGSAGEEAGR